ncbi:MAG: HNH endonuclease [Pseudomonadota bacterium]|nr:HNH endonuclease [Pseudomonadota bacterium]
MSKKKAPGFRDLVIEAGGEWLGPTNPYELMRFRTVYGVGVVYSGKRGETWNAEAVKARDHIQAGKGSLAPVTVRGRRTGKATVEALIARDGDGCFFCGLSLEGDITVEHLVSIAHGGPNHISNLFLSHAECNRKAGHMAAPLKIAMRDEMRAKLEAPHG